MRLVGTLILWISSVAVLLFSVLIGVVAHKVPYAPAVYAAVAAGVLFALLLNPLFASLTRLRGRPVVRWGLVGVALLAGIVGTGFSVDQLLFEPTRAFNQAVAMVEKHPGDKAVAEQAARLYQSACDARVYEACHNLGVLHDLAGPLPRDPGLTGPLYDKACEHGVALSCVNRGRQYFAGDGVKTDQERARTLYAKACNAKIPEGCTGLMAADLAGSFGGNPAAKRRLVADYKLACANGVKAACVSPEDLQDLVEEDDMPAADNAAAASDDSMTSDAPAADAPAANDKPAATQAAAPVQRPPSPSTTVHHRTRPRPSATPSPSAWSIS